MRMADPIRGSIRLSRSRANHSLRLLTWMLKSQPDMNLFFLALKIATVALFLVMFIRTGQLAWAVGLLTVTSAILLDAFLGTFGRDEMIEEFGFFFFVIAGGLFAGATAWFWLLLRPYLSAKRHGPAGAVETFENPGSGSRNDAGSGDKVGTAVDRQLLFDQIRQRLSPDDILDVVFDLGMSENEVVGFYQDANQIIVRLIDLAEQQGQSGQLALSVERILSPIRREDLPRPEKLNADSPPMVLRHYLLAKASNAEIEGMATSLEVDWEYLAGAGKKAKTRNLLLYLQRRNRLQELVDLMKERWTPQDVSEEES